MASLWPLQELLPLQDPQPSEINSAFKQASSPTHVLLQEGICDNVIVGISLGKGVLGDALGKGELGDALGDSDGLLEGRLLGDSEGTNEGALEGEDDGLELGNMDGDREGNTDGS